jgi:hypothetical protein
MDKSPNEIKKFWNFHIPEYWKEILLLLLITPFLTELLTNNIPARHFTEPELFLTLALLVYGPVLIFREIAVRWHLNLCGLILLGLAYGIYNEGLLGKTFFQTHLPNPAFDNYGVVWNINLTWGIVIIIFHAFFAFLFPLIIIYNIFPSSAAKTWISVKWLTVYSAAFFIYISYNFFKKMQDPVGPLHFIILICVIAGLMFLSKKFVGELQFRKRKLSLWPLALYGLLFVTATFVVSNLIALTRINPFFFILYNLAILVFTIYLLNKKYGINELLIFCIISEIGFLSTCIYVAVIMKLENNIITSSVFASLLIITLIFIIIKSNMPRDTKA